MRCERLQLKFQVAIAIGPKTWTANAAPCALSHLIAHNHRCVTTTADRTRLMQVFLDLQEIEKQDLVEFYDSKILSSGSDTRALVVACTSNRHSRVFEAGVQGRWVLLDPIAARNKLPVAPWSVSNAIHNMAVGMAVPGSRLMCCSCTCCDD